MSATGPQIDRRGNKAERHRDDVASSRISATERSHQNQIWLARSRVHLSSQALGRRRQTSQLLKRRGRRKWPGRVYWTVAGTVARWARVHRTQFAAPNWQSSLLARPHGQVARGQLNRARIITNSDRVRCSTRRLRLELASTFWRLSEYSSIAI